MQQNTIRAPCPSRVLSSFFPLADSYGLARAEWGVGRGKNNSKLQTPNS
ncbi:hypothetical protein LC613_22735 [Nostoc sphaeroides CHAB 2801]|nr:hypothetical protein [Nostoc sphaeroides]MCC5630664.1 hypothetical protein [Nostoc sphaeroides CHAB 2801]